MPQIRIRPGALSGVDVKLLLLSFASGSMDSLSFLKLGEVFTSAMTGNTALMGLALGRGNLLAASRSLTAFLGFVLGVTLGAVMLRRDPAATRWSVPVGRVIAVEAILLLVFTALWLGADAPHTPQGLYGVIIISAVAMGLQTAAVAHMKVPGVTTTYFTGTLATIISTLVGRGGPDRRTLAPTPAPATRLQMLIFLTYFLSACAIGVLTQVTTNLVAIVPLAAVGCVLLGLRGTPRRSRD